MCEVFLAGCMSASDSHRLMDVLHRNLKLTMVFEFCDQVCRLCRAGCICTQVVM